MMIRKIERIIQEIAGRLVSPIDRWANKQFYEFPFGSFPRANADAYIEIWNQAKSREYAVIDQFEKTLGYSMDEKWFHDLALLTQVVIKKSDICYQHGRLLYSALSAYITLHKHGSLNILETGTARGFSSLCIAKALQDAGQPGKIITIDVLPHDVKMYWNCIADEKGPRSRSELLMDYRQIIEDNIIFIQGDSMLQLKKINIPRIHFAFLDGAHTYEYVQKEFDFVKDKQEKGDIIFFDDYTPAYFPGIVKAVDEICEKHNYSKEILSVGEQRGYVIARKN